MVIAVVFGIVDGVVVDVVIGAAPAVVVVVVVAISHLMSGSINPSARFEAGSMAESCEGSSSRLGNLACRGSGA